MILIADEGSLKHLVKHLQSKDKTEGNLCCADENKGTAGATRR